MKKITALVLAVILCLLLSACGKSEAVKNVEAMIDALGKITLESEPAVAAAEAGKATVFSYRVADPERYGVAEFDAAGNCVSLEEKPQHPQSHSAVVGLYFYPNKVIDVAADIEPSVRGELEITTINRHFLDAGELLLHPLSRDCVWLDMGTHDSLIEASTLVEVLERRQGINDV